MKQAISKIFSHKRMTIQASSIWQLKNKLLFGIFLQQAFYLIFLKKTLPILMKFEKKKL